MTGIRPVQNQRRHRRTTLEQPGRELARQFRQRGLSSMCKANTNDSTGAFRGRRAKVEIPFILCACENDY